VHILILTGKKNNNNWLFIATLRLSNTDPNNTLEEQSTELQGVDDDEPSKPLFGGSSENGFIVGEPQEQTWVCTVTDGVLKHTF
jgi:hypothetical protein